MKEQLTLFNASEYQSDPWPVPPHLRRISMLDWMRQNADRLADEFVKEMPNFSFLVGDLYEDHFRNGTFPLESIKYWVEKKYQDAMQHAL